jgi:hypothetical protein
MSNAPIKAEKKTGFLSKVLGKGGRKDDGLKVVEMSRGEYLKYWAKGEDGKFLDSVVEPPGERGEWVRRQVEFQQEMKGGGMVEKPNLLSAAVAGLGSS